MKILYHHRTQGRGGEGVHIRETIKALRSLGHEVFVVSPFGVDVFAEDEKNESYEARSKASTRFWVWISKNAPQIIFELMEIVYNVIAGRNIKKVLANNKIDFIYERYAFFLWAGTALAKTYGIPIILEVNEVSGIQRQRGQILAGLANNMERRIFKRSSAIVVVSNYLKNAVIKRSADPNKVVLIPNAVNEARFDPRANGSDIRSRLGLNNDTVLGFAGYFSKWDRLSSFLGVFCDIAKERSDVRLMIIGDSRKKEEREELEKIVETNGMAGRIVFSGRVKRNDMPSCISAADIFVIPHSNPFGSPLVLFEYMAMAKPIIAPRIGPIEDVLTNGINGVLFDMGNYASLKQCIIELVDNREKRKKIGEAARSTVLAQHTWAKNAEKILSIGDKILCSKT
jgi:glycosyltransferase involved in cell wall biosynthesis